MRLTQIFSLKVSHFSKLLALVLYRCNTNSTNGNQNKFAQRELMIRLPLLQTLEMTLNDVDARVSGAASELLDICNKSFCVVYTSINDRKSYFLCCTSDVCVVNLFPFSRRLHQQLQHTLCSMDVDNFRNVNLNDNSMPVDRRIPD